MQSSTQDVKAAESQRHLALGDTNPEAAEEETKPFGALILVALGILLFFAGGRNIFLTTVGIIVMIFLHELGHFATARWTGMKATQFFLGFGKTIFSFKKGDTTYGVKAIPAGAFVRILGMHNLDPVEPADEHRAYRNATYPRRMLVITAGSMMHFAQALLLFILLFAVVGLPEPILDQWRVDASSFSEDTPVEDQAPAELAGVLAGDDILTVDGLDVTNWDVLRDVVGDRPGETVELTGQRDDGTPYSATITLGVRADDATMGFLGVSPEFETENVKPGVVEGVKEFGSVMYQSTLGLPQIFSPATATNLGTQVVNGPGEVDINSDEANRPLSILGLIRLANDVNPLILLAYVNAFVGLFNLLPLLPLDGGHAIIATYERIRSRKNKPYHADFAKALPITYMVVLMLGFLFLTTIWLDLTSPITTQ